MIKTKQNKTKTQKLKDPRGVISKERVALIPV